MISWQKRERFAIVAFLITLALSHLDVSGWASWAVSAAIGCGGAATIMLTISAAVTRSHTEQCQGCQR